MVDAKSPETVASMHPTKRRLIETVSVMLDGQQPYDVLIDSVLRESGVSKGSLYHHFEDFPDLVEQTLVLRFSDGVDETIRMMRAALDQSQSADDFWRRMHDLVLFSQDPARAPRRAERARVIGMAGGNERFARLLGREQDRLTGEITEVVSVAQRNGWVRTELSPHAIALFIQAYTLGRALDDVAEQKVNAGEWASLIELVTASFKNDS